MMPAGPGMGSHRLPGEGRDDGDRPLPAARCREAAAALTSVTPASIEAPAPAAARHNLADRRTADPGDPHGGDL